MNTFISTFEYKLIYIFRINDNKHKDLLKIGETTINTDKSFSELFPNCSELNKAAKNRINQYTTTAGIEYELLYTEVAVFCINKNEKTKIKAFGDKDVHSVLERSGIKRHFFDTDKKANEWFKVDLNTAKNAIRAVKEERSSLNSNDISQSRNPLIFRPEQEKAIKETVKQFKIGNKMLWNAKMRFGKTLTALQVAKQMQFKRTLILTHRPVVSDGWFEDFDKIFYDTDYVFGSKSKGEKIENLANTDKNFVYFASMQDLRGSDIVGGKFDKNDDIFLTEWNFIIIDEAHEGTLTKLGKNVINTLTDLSGNSKILRLSGTPFNLLDDFTENETFTWDYVMEQRAKIDWDKTHPGDSNPYANLPKLQMFTYNLDKLLPNYIDVEDSAFNFREFFRTWTGNVEKDFKPMPENCHVGDFIHEKDINKFLDMLCKYNKDNNYPFSNEQYRNYFRHSLWIVPGVKEAKALSSLLQKHPVFGVFKIANVAGDGDEEMHSKDALQTVRNAFGENPDETYSITISCGRLTTGVSVPEWTAVFMLAGTYSTSAANYMQTIFRVQTPASINGKIKQYCYAFDFAPDRTLKIIAEVGKISAKAGRTNNDTKIIGEFLNFCPVISIDGANMRKYDVNGLLQQLKKAYTKKVVENGFDDEHIYNDNLLKLNNIDIKQFEKLKGIIGKSKQTQNVEKASINNQGFTNEEYDEILRIEKKKPKERSEEEKQKLAELEQKKKARQNAISILRGISIRIPLMIYGADIPYEEEITPENFTSIVNKDSWAEFMPKGVTKDMFNDFAKYYDTDIFIAAGRTIRDKVKSADSLPPMERVQKIAQIFSTFRNPDKETVLTPWRVVNMHMSDCLGGYDFYDEQHESTLSEPRYVDRGEVTKETLANTNAHILEINSKTGLYPLYVTYSIYRAYCKQINPNLLTFEKQLELWDTAVKENIYVICKTPMARSITKRTLLGYRYGEINAHAFDDLIMQLKDKPKQFRDKILRGSYWNKEVTEMKFDAVVGNPPYQESDGGSGTGISAKPTYNYFIQQAKRIHPQYLSMIIPARWYAGGKGLDHFRNEMLKDKHITQLFDYPKSRDCFDNVDIAGGICYFLWDKNHESMCNITSRQNNTESTSNRYLDEFDIFIRNNIGINIIHKTKLNSNDTISKLIYNRNPFGFVSSERGEPAKFENSIKLISSAGEGYVNKDIIRKNINCIAKYKVIIGKVNPDRGGVNNSTDGKMNVITKVKIVDPDVVFTETYLMLGAFSNKKTAENYATYFKCKFSRMLISLTLSSMNISTPSFQFVPLQDFTENSDINWSVSVEEIDRQLYAKYGLNQEEIDFIESTIKPME